MKEFIYDFFSLDSKNIDKWSKEFFWPISRKKTQRILIDIIDIFCKHIKKEKNVHIKNCLIAYHHFNNPYVIIFNYLLLKDKINNSKYKIKYSNRSKVMRYLYDENVNFPIEPECFINKNKKASISKLLKNKFRTFLFNFSKKIFIPDKKNLAIDQEGILKQDFFKSFNEWLNITSIERLKKDYKTEKIDKKLEVAINSINQECIKYSKHKLKIEIPQKIKDDILGFQKTYFTNINSLLLSLYKNKELKNTKKFFVASAKTVYRAISLVIKKNGGSVYGFPHGSWICHSFSKRPIYEEFFIYDYFCIYNNSQKILFDDYKKKKRLGNSIKFISQKSNIFDKYKSHYNFKLPSKIKTVMILENQLWSDDIRFELPETMIIYEFYYHLCSLLSSYGYKIYFKKRPKSNPHNFNFFKNINNIEIIKGDIMEKKNIDLADIIIFLYGLSSTFIPLICSNKILIYFDSCWENWNPKVYKVLKKRCRIIKTFNVEGNKIRFKTSELKNSLKIPKENIDQLFFNKFLSINPKKNKL